jgi:hypothetical protein
MKIIISERQYKIISEQSDSKFGLERSGNSPEEILSKKKKEIEKRLKEIEDEIAKLTSKKLSNDLESQKNADKIKVSKLKEKEELEKILKKLGLGFSPKSDNTYVRKQTPMDNEQFNKLQKCMGNYSEKILSDAVKWWENWLKTPTTLNKFANNWGISTEEASKIFQKYFTSLKNIKLKYELIKNGGRAYVSKNDNFIHINCDFNVSGEYSEKMVETLVHEIQHILFKIKPFHPEKKVISDFKFDTEDEEQNLSKISRDLTNQGLINAEKFINKYKDYVRKNGTRYLENENEMLSRISGIRKALVLKPGQDIMLKDFILLVNISNVDADWILKVLIHKGISIQEMLNMINRYAKNNSAPIKNKEYNV